MSTFTRRPDQPWRCDVCRAPIGRNVTWPQLQRHFLESHTPAIYHATRHQNQEDES